MKNLILMALLTLSSASAFANTGTQFFPGPIFEKTNHCWGGNFYEKGKFACAQGIAVQGALADCRKAGCEICALVQLSPAGVTTDEKYGGYAQIQGINCGGTVPVAPSK